MTHIDNSKVFHEGTYSDVNVTVPSNTTYSEGTVLGRNSSGELVAYSTENDTDSFTSEPLYILAQDLINSSDEAVEKTLVRVFDGGVVDASKLIFVNSDDSEDDSVLDTLKTNGFRVLNVEAVVENTPFADETKETT